MASSSADVVSETRLVSTEGAFAYMGAAQALSGVTVEAVVPRDDDHGRLLAAEHARGEARRRYGMLGEPATAAALGTVSSELMDEIVPRFVGPDADGVLLRIRTYRDEGAGARFQQLADLALNTKVLPQ